MKKLFIDARYSFREDTLENWIAYNPILEKGEPSIVRNPNNESEWLKIGDGETTWNELPWKKGPKGETGEKGDKGETGEKGDKGEYAEADLVYNPESENAQSGIAVAEAVASKADTEYVDNNFPKVGYFNEAMSTKTDIEEAIYRGVCYQSTNKDLNGDWIVVESETSTSSLYDVILKLCPIESENTSEYTEVLILKNLTQNAIEFMGAGRKISITHKSELISTNYATVNVTVYKILSDKADKKDVDNLEATVATKMDKFGVLVIDGYNVRWLLNEYDEVIIEGAEIIADGFADPISEKQVANKKYVDTKIGDIETALDELHTYAQALVNGGATE